MNKTVISLGVLVVVMGYVVCSYAGRNAVKGIGVSRTQGTRLSTDSATQAIDLGGAG